MHRLSPQRRQNTPRCLSPPFSFFSFCSFAEAKAIVCLDTIVSILPVLSSFRVGPIGTMPDEAFIDVPYPQPFRSVSPPDSPSILPVTSTSSPPAPPLPFRQHLLWSGSLLLFTAYLTAVLYFFLTSPPFRFFVVHRANTLFALPYVLSLFVVLLCLAPCWPAPARPQLDAVITSPADCALVLLVLLEWATCLALVLVTLIAVHDHLSYVSADGLIVPTDITSPSISHKHPSQTGDGISHDAVVILIVPIFLMYCLFNCLIHLYSCIEAAWRAHHHYTDLD